MATEILRPHDLLTHPIPSIRNPSPSPCHHHHHHHHPKPFKKQQRRGERYSKRGAAAAAASLFIGHVKILKRGESVDSIKKDSDSDPKVMKQVRIVEDRVGECDDKYAGSAFWMSPSPRALPLPRFSKPAVDQSATMDLRRLLRLD